MSHCSEPNPERSLSDMFKMERDHAADFLAKFREHCPKPQTREFPDGRIAPTDDGVCKMGVSVVKGRVVIAFDRPMDWVGFTAQEASDLADSLRDAGLKARGID